MTSQPVLDTKRRSATIICKIPSDLLADLNQVAAELRQSRSLLIRDAINRRIAHYQRHERTIVRQLEWESDQNHRLTDQGAAQ